MAQKVGASTVLIENTTSVLNTLTLQLKTTFKFSPGYPISSDLHGHLHSIYPNIHIHTHTPPPPPPITTTTITIIMKIKIK